MPRAVNLHGMPVDELPPHPELTRYYANGGAKRGFLKSIFDNTAEDYDRVENIVALGSGRWYRRNALIRAGLRPGMRALDVAIGTGLVAREAMALVAPGGSVTGLDPSLGMISRARSALDLSVVLGVGEQLPFEDGTFDFLSMGYALRHLSDLRLAMSEFRRVLKPGGRVCLLEIARPDGVVRRKLMEAYFRGLLPIVSRLISTRPQTGRLWVYYWETIDQCVPAMTVLRAMSDAGLIDVARYTELGMFAEYTGRRA